MDTKPRKLNDLQRKALKVLANQVLVQLKIRKSCVSMADQIEKLDEQAKTIQLQQVALIANARMSSLGQMARGLAHEINNPLAIILGRISIMESWYNSGIPDTQKMIKSLEQLHTTSLRIAKIVSGLRSYVRSDATASKEIVRLDEIFENTIALVTEKFKMAQINLAIDPLPPLNIECRPSQISQIIMNLISNAFDACENTSDANVELKFLYDNGLFTCQVIDNGTGVLDEVKETLFDPFVTTKAPDKGTGIGLSIAATFAKEHQGSLSYECKNNLTVFTLVLPATFQADHLSTQLDLEAVADPDLKSVA